MPREAHSIARPRARNAARGMWTKPVAGGNCRPTMPATPARMRPHRRSDIIGSRGDLRLKTNEIHAHRGAAARCFAVAVAAALASLAAFMPARAADKPLNPPVKVRFGLVGGLSDAGIILADGLGFFKAQGLDVKFVQFKAGPETIPALATGQVQGAGLAVSPGFFNALSRGVKLKLVADKGQVNRNSHWAAIVMRSDLKGKIRSFKDLKGLKFAVPGRGVTSFTELVYALKLGGLTVHDVDITELSFPNMVVALSNKGIDAATMIEPFVTISAAKKVGFDWKEPPQYYPYIPAENGLVAYSEDFQKQQPEAAKRWMVAYLEGVRAYLAAMSDGTDRAKVIDVLAAALHTPNRSIFDHMAPTGFDPDGKFALGSIEEDERVGLELGLVKQKVDISKVVDYSYIDYAAKKLGPMHKGGSP